MCREQLLSTMNRIILVGSLRQKWEQVTHDGDRYGGSWGAGLDQMVGNGFPGEVTFSSESLSSVKSFNQPLQEQLFLKPAFL